jgi:hypothetical protein
MLSCMSWVLKVQGSELEMVIDKRSWAALISVRLALQLVHVDDARLGSALIELGNLEGTGSGGKVVNLCGGDFTYNHFCMSQNDIKSDTPSIIPFNLIPYLNCCEQLPYLTNVCITHLVATSCHLHSVCACPYTATVQDSLPILYNVAR